MRTRNLLLLLALTLPLGGCEFFSSLIHNDEVVAVVGKDKLYRSEIENLIPPGLNAADSTAMALQYINSWASDMVFVNIAESQLSKQELDLSEEMESYRRSLLRYRYEQRYVDQRLDTQVSEEELRAYYEAHRESFRSEQPLVKARFIRLSSDSPLLDQVKTMLCTSDPAILVELDSLSYNAADRYVDHSETWTDLSLLAREFDLDYRELEGRMRGGFAEIENPAGKINMAYVLERIPAGGVAPFEYCEPGIREVILSARRQALRNSLQEELINQARQSGTFIIYDNEKK